VFLGDDFPLEWRGSFILNRFGNFIRTPKDNVGFDIVQAKLEKDAKGVYQAHIYSILKPLGRPIDVHHSGHGKLYICEYTRPTNNQGSFALPGRILELSFNADQASN
jgi:glucose/arabinose dehydrogenase